MKLYVEAIIHAYIDDAFDLSAEEEAEYQALTTDEERRSWLGDLAREGAWDLSPYERRLGDIEWRLSDAE